MGVDAAICIKDTDEYFWLNRLHNLFVYKNLPDPLYGKADILFDRLRKDGLSADEAVTFLDFCIESLKYDLNCYEELEDEIFDLVKKYPDSDFLPQELIARVIEYQKDKIEENYEYECNKKYFDSIREFILKNMSRDFVVRSDVEMSHV